MAGRIWLDVPFSEKDEAKALGASWDAAAERWYAPRPGMTALDPWGAQPDLPALLPGEESRYPILASGSDGLVFNAEFVGPVGVADAEEVVCGTRGKRQRGLDRRRLLEGFHLRRFPGLGGICGLGEALG